MSSVDTGEKMSCKGNEGSGRGGRRPGAGRKPLPAGWRKATRSITLPGSFWDALDQMPGKNRHTKIQQAVVDFYHLMENIDDGE